MGLQVSVWVETSNRDNIFISSLFPTENAAPNLTQTMYIERGQLLSWLPNERRDRPPPPSYPWTSIWSKIKKMKKRQASTPPHSGPVICPKTAEEKEAGIHPSPFRTLHLPQNRRRKRGRPPPPSPPQNLHLPLAKEYEEEAGLHPSPPTTPRWRKWREWEWECCT